MESVDPDTLEAKDLYECVIEYKKLKHRGHDGRFDHSGIATAREHSVMKTGKEDTDYEICDDNFDSDEIGRARSSNIESNKPVSLRKYHHNFQKIKSCSKDKQIQYFKFKDNN